MDDKFWLKIKEKILRKCVVVVAVGLSLEDAVDAVGEGAQRDEAVGLELRFPEIGNYRLFAVRIVVAGALIGEGHDFLFTDAYQSHVLLVEVAAIGCYIIQPVLTSVESLYHLPYGAVAEEFGVGVLAWLHFRYHIVNG